MKFSIVTISFNQAEFLERTLQSVLSQKGVEIEYIVCDPGSTDGSRDIIEKYRDQIAHIIYDKDAGPADGLNKGFARATGDIYCYLNSDDTLEPDALVTAARFLENHPEYDVICGHAWVTDRNDNRLRRVWSEPFTHKAVAYGSSVQIQPSTFIRRSAFLKCGGFNPENRTGWDNELLVDLFLSGAHIGIFPAFVSTYRLHETSITNSGKLIEAMKKSGPIRFQKLMGRPMHSYDKFIGFIYKLYKHLSSPLATWERITKGPIFNRGIR